MPSFILFPDRAALPCSRSSAVIAPMVEISVAGHGTILRIRRKGSHSRGVIRAAAGEFLFILEMPCAHVKMRDAVTFRGIVVGAEGSTPVVRLVTLRRVTQEAASDRAGGTR